MPPRLTTPPRHPQLTLARHEPPLLGWRDVLLVEPVGAGRGREDAGAATEPVSYEEAAVEALDRGAARWGEVRWRFRHGRLRWWGCAVLVGVCWVVLRSGFWFVVGSSLGGRFGKGA